MCSEQALRADRGIFGIAYGLYLLGNLVTQLYTFFFNLSIFTQSVYVSLYELLHVKENLPFLCFSFLSTINSSFSVVWNGLRSIGVGSLKAC